LACTELGCAQETALTGTTEHRAAPRLEQQYGAQWKKVLTKAAKDVESPKEKTASFLAKERDHVLLMMNPSDKIQRKRSDTDQT